MWIGDPNAMMKLMFYIDSKADADQRQALERIFTGEVGGWPAEFASLIEGLRGIEYAPPSHSTLPMTSPTGVPRYQARSTCWWRP